MVSSLDWSHRVLFGAQHKARLLQKHHSNLRSFLQSSGQRTYYLKQMIMITASEVVTICRIIIIYSDNTCIQMHHRPKLRQKIN